MRRIVLNKKQSDLRKESERDPFRQWVVKNVPVDLSCFDPDWHEVLKNHDASVQGKGLIISESAIRLNPYDHELAKSYGSAVRLGLEISKARGVPVIVGNLGIATAFVFSILFPDSDLRTHRQSLGEKLWRHSTGKESFHSGKTGIKNSARFSYDSGSISMVFVEAIRTRLPYYLQTSAIFPSSTQE